MNECCTSMSSLRVVEDFIVNVATEVSTSTVVSNMSVYRYSSVPLHRYRRSTESIPMERNCKTSTARQTDLGTARCRLLLYSTYCTYTVPVRTGTRTYCSSYEIRNTPTVPVHALTYKPTRNTPIRLHAPTKQHSAGTSKWFHEPDDDDDDGDDGDDVGDPPSTKRATADS